MKSKNAGVLVFIAGAYYFISSLIKYLEVTDSDRTRNSVIIMICVIVLMIIGTIAYRKALKKAQKS